MEYEVKLLKVMDLLLLSYPTEPRARARPPVMLSSDMRNAGQMRFPCTLHQYSYPNEHQDRLKRKLICNRLWKAARPFDISCHISEHLGCLSGQIKTRGGARSLFSLLACLPPQKCMFRPKKCVVNTTKCISRYWKCAQGL